MDETKVNEEHELRTEEDIRMRSKDERSGE
jgi:hypothetical protein